MAIDTSFNGFKKQYEKANKELKNTGISGSGGFFPKTTERKYKAVLNYWEKNIVRNGNRNDNVSFLNQITFGTKGDLSKIGKIRTKMFNDDYHAINKLISNLKSSKNKKVYENLKDNSIFRTYVECIEILNEKKYIDTFRKAYDEWEKYKGKDVPSIASLFIMCNQIIVYFVCFCTSIMFREIDLNPTISEYYSEEDFAKHVESVQEDYKTIIGCIGFTAIEISTLLKNLKDPVKEITKALEKETEVNKNIKSMANYDMAEKQVKYLEFSKECWLEDKAQDPTKGNEEAVTVALIVLGSIVGFFLLVALIRRAIYMISTIKTDIMSYIMIDEATTRMNIQILEEKINAEEDEKEKKRLEKIRDKQLAWLAKFEKMTAELKQSSAQSMQEAEGQIQEEDKYIDSHPMDDDSSDSGNWEIVM